MIPLVPLLLPRSHLGVVPLHAEEGSLGRLLPAASKIRTLACRGMDEACFLMSSENLCTREFVTCVKTANPKEGSKRII